MKKILIAVATTTFLSAPALAHVKVTPENVGVAKFQTFSISVPNEKDTATTAIRLVMPDGLKEVTPTIKAGWTVDVKKDGTGDDAKVTEIDWTGSLPVGYRDDFTFSAQVPDKPTTLNWKAYQTYQSGEVVSWDQDPNVAKSSDTNAPEPTPYSTTAVVNDLTDQTSTKTDETPLYLSLLAVVIATAALLKPSPKKS